MIPGDYSITFTGDSISNGENIQNVSAVYSDAWANATGQPITGPLSPGQFEIAGDYCIIRSFLLFDTSGLPDEAVITSAHVQLMGYDDYSDADFKVSIQTLKEPAPHDPLISIDYNKGWAPPTATIGQRNTSSFVDEDYFNISLNASGLSDINISGVTNWVLRSNQDIIASAPAAGVDEWVQFYGPGGVWPERGPYLIINYTIPSSNWQHIVNLTFHTNESGPWLPYNTTWVQSNGTVTVPAVMFDAVARYWWNISYNSNHTNYGNTSYWWFETVMTGGSGGGGGGSQRTTTYFVLGACMGTLVGGLVLNIWRKKKKQTS